MPGTESETKGRTSRCIDYEPPNLAVNSQQAGPRVPREGKTSPQGQVDTVMTEW